MSEGKYSVDSLTRSLEDINNIRSSFEFRSFKAKFKEVLIQQRKENKIGCDPKDWLEMITSQFDDLMIERAYLKVNECSKNYEDHIGEYIQIVDGTFSSTVGEYYWNYVVFDLSRSNKLISIPELIVLFDQMTSTETLFNWAIMGENIDFTPEKYRKIVDESEKKKIDIFTELWFLETKDFDSYVQWLPREIVETTLEICV